MPIREQLILEGVNNTQKTFNQVQRSLGSMEKSTAALDKGFGSVRRTILGVASALGGISIGRNIIQVTARFEDLRTTLSSVTGSAMEGAKAFDFVSKFSTKTQFGVEELATTFVKLKSNGIEPSTKLLTTFTDAAAVTTDQIGSLTAITDFYTRSLQSQTVELMDLDRLADRGLPVYDILKQKLGVSRSELSKFSKEAGNTQLIIDALGEGINERFGGATAARIENLSTRLSNFTIALKNSADVMGQQFSAALGTGIEQFTNFLASNDKMMREMGDSLVKLSVNVLLGTGRILDALAPIFNFIKQGINGLVRFVNQLPPEFQILGMIGFFLVGRGVKIILLAVAALFDEIKGAMDSAMKFVENILNKIVRGYNRVMTKLGLNPLDEVVFGDGAFSSMVDEMNKKFVNFLDTVTQDLTPIAFEFTGMDPEDADKYYNTFKKLTDKMLAEQNKVNKAAQFGGSAMAAGQAGALKSTKVSPTDPNVKKQADELKKKFEQLEESLQSEELKEINSYNNRLKILDDYYNQKGISDERYAALREKLEVKHQAKLKEIQEKNRRAQLEAEFKGRGVTQADLEKRLEMETATRAEQARFVLDNTVKTFDALGQQNKKAFQAYKAFAIAQAIIDTYASAQSAFRALVGIPVVGPVLAFSAAAAAIAGGFARVNAIRAQTYGGRREGGAVTGGSPFLVGEDNQPEVFTPHTNGRIIPLDKLSTGKKVDVHFNINTLDASDFQDLLVRERGLIVNIINDAVLEQGREAIV